MKKMEKWEPAVVIPEVDALLDANPAARVIKGGDLATIQRTFNPPQGVWIVLTYRGLPVVFDPELEGTWVVQ